MAATEIRTPADLPATDFAEYIIEETLSTLGTAESVANRLDPNTAYDVGCALHGAREALERALSTLRAQQTQAPAVPLLKAA